MILALSTLCEHPRRKTGLTTLFQELVGHALDLYPDISWIIFADPEFEWTVNSPRVRVIRTFRGIQSLIGRLAADHFGVPLVARSLGVSALITVGFVPILRTTRVAMHLLVLTHLRKESGLGVWRHRYRRWMTISGLRRADLVITNSQWCADEINEFAPTCRGRMIVSYEGLQHETFHPLKGDGEEGRLREAFKVSPGYFLWMSNFYLYKQANLLLRGYAELDPQLRKKHPLVMVGGSWDGGADSARAEAERLGIQSDVHFLGWVAEEWLAPLYRSAAALCFPSREETFGRSVLEAMACGTPCILNDIPIMREVSGGHALIIDYSDSSRVVDALQRVLTDPNLCASLRRGGVDRASHFHFDRVATERIDAIRDRVQNGSVEPS